ncbi:unnamed protein product [Lactuca virosa]|uniref:Uncharacterized protein n=1 Tax=Lactuca virosa TaxID=75947 RepID=A0AAU9MCK6_9ASTR|nr:unnamed protein product [Lactuca virosa]
MVVWWSAVKGHLVKEEEVRVGVDEGGWQRITVENEDGGFQLKFGVAGNLRFYWKLTFLCMRFCSLRCLDHLHSISSN